MYYIFLNNLKIYGNTNDSGKPNNNNQMNSILDLNFGGVSSGNTGNNMNFIGSGQSNNTNNTYNNNSTGFELNFGQSNNTNNTSSGNNYNMKQIFNNNEITIYCSSQTENNTTNAVFQISNNIDKPLSNLKVNFMVTKNVTPKIISTSGTNLEPRQSFGFKKVKYLY